MKLIHLEITQIKQPERRQSDVLYYMVQLYYNSIKLSHQEYTSFNMTPIKNLDDAVTLVKRHRNSLNAADKCEIILIEHARNNVSYTFKPLK